MPEFLWRAAHADGQAAEGRTEAAAEADVLRQLRERGLTPIRVQPAGQAEGAALAGPRPRAARGPVKPADVLSLTSELDIMLRAGLALNAARSEEQRLNSSHYAISYAVFCLKKKKK